MALACSRDPLQAPPPPPEPPSPPPSTNRPPTAVVRPTQVGQEGVASAGFTAEGSADPDGDSLYFTWNWGDGTTLTGTNVRQLHDYVDNGEYAVVLRVTDSHGAAADASTRVSISNATPVILGVDLATPPMPSSVPMTAIIHAQVFDAGANDHPVLSIDWGDGGTSTDTVHIYRNPGAYALSLTVTDKDGASSQQGLSRLVWVYDLSQHASVPGYEVIDLGTLGGEFTWPFALNNRGEVVGTSATAGGKSRPFLWRDGAITDINPPGEDLQEARTINDVGAIAGSGGQGRLPTWSDGVFTGFVSVPSSEYGAWPVRILESRDVIVNVEKHEFPTPLFVRNGTVVNLGSLSIAPHGWALDINSRDQIVGRSAYQGIGLADYEFRAFLWEDGTMRELGNLGTAPCEYVPEQRCGPSAARDINEAGDVVGVAFNGATSRAVLWSAADRTPHDLGFGSGASEAVAINERGQIAGDDGDDGFFRDADGAVRSIGSLGGGKTQVAGMSEDGVIAGTSRTASGDIHAFVWRPDGGMDDLGAGPFGGSHVATTAIAVNDRGDILGTAQPCETSGSCPGWGQTRGVLWRRIASPLVSRRP